MKSCSRISKITGNVVLDQLVSLVVVTFASAYSDLNLIFGGILSDGDVSGSGGTNSYFIRI